MKLTDKRIVVIGATAEIGRAASRALSEAGAVLYLHGHQNERALSDLAANTNAAGTALADISREHEVQVLFGKIAGVWPEGFDAVVSCAGINPSAAPTGDVSLADWQDTIDVNLTGTFLCVRSAVRVLKKNAGGGKIVLISSIFGLESPTNRVAYSASKHGLTALVQTVSKEFGGPPNPIEINALCPGPVWSSNVRRIFERHAEERGVTVEEYVKERVSRIPAARFLDPDELARKVTFFCSSDSDYINGQVIPVTGGATE